MFENFVPTAKKRPPYLYKYQSNNDVYGNFAGYFGKKMELYSDSVVGVRNY
jgi:hypothetical protein